MTITIQQAIGEARANCHWGVATAEDEVTMRLLLDIADRAALARSTSEPVLAHYVMLDAALQAFTDHMGKET